jgi:hypothetical protein
MEWLKMFFKPLFPYFGPVEPDNESQDKRSWWPFSSKEVSSRHLIKIVKSVEQACTA